MKVERKGGNNKKNLSIIMKIALTLQSPKNNLGGGGVPAHTQRINCSNNVGIHSPTLPTTTLYALLCLNLPIGHPPFLHLSCFLLHKENTTVKKLHQAPTTEPAGSAPLLYLFCNHAWSSGKQIPPPLTTRMARAILLSLLEKMYKYAL